jgi:hypothetical protein
MIYLLFDNPTDSGCVSFISRLSRLQLKEVFSPKSGRLILGWLKGVQAALCLSGKGDTIVCWYDFQAVLCFWMCKLLCKKRKIVCINILLKDKTSLKNKVVAGLYRFALHSQNFVASVTSAEYGAHLKLRLGVSKPLFLVHDVYHGSYQYGRAEIIPNTVFCGGRNGRDWNFMIEVAKAMPSVEFHLVMPKSVYQEVHDTLPSNVMAKHSISMDDFMAEMCSCELVALPLDTEAPAGLIVLFQAAANNKYIITTDTMTTREYLSCGRGSLVPNSVELWKKEITERLTSKDENKIVSHKLLEFLQCECSEEKFVEGVEKMIKSLKVC